MFYIKLCKIKEVLILFNKKKFCENKIYKFCIYIYVYIINLEIVVIYFDIY